MSELNTFIRKKKSRGQKSKSSTPRTKQKKRKSRLSLEYQETEREVQELLENTSLSIDISSSVNELYDSFNSESVNFFCRTSEEVSFRRTHHFESSAATEKTDQTDDSDELDEKADSEESAKTPTDQTFTPANQTTASTYIQVDEDAVTQLSERLKHELSTDLLYTPSTELNVSVSAVVEPNERELSGRTKRMLNRYYEEAKANDRKLSAEIVATLTHAQREQTFVKDTTLYRTYCEHTFHAIFCEPMPEVVEIPTRKFIKLYIKELRFTDHPQLVEEHRLANSLEDMYEQYVQRVKAQVSEKLRAELQTERKIVGELLNRTASDDDTLSTASAERRAQRLQQHVLAVKLMRNKLYEEETAQKQLLTSILDTWIQLKNVRKKQEYQCTRFRLRIKVNESADVAAERYKWTQRYELDLNEIYREELETYYCSKRLWQTRDKSDDSLIRPRKPDILKISKELRATLAECTYAPGEPKVEVLRSRLSDEEFYDMRGQFKLKSFIMRIYFDQQFVGVTRSYRLEPDLSLRINEAIGIFLERRLPKDIRIALYEKSRLPAPKKVANIMVPLPLPMDNAEIPQKVKFTSHKQPIAGCLYMRFQCDEQIYPSDMLSVQLPPSKQQTPSPKKVFKEWYADKLLQQANNCAQDHAMLSAASEDEDETAHSKSGPTCSLEENLLQFCAVDELQHNQRFKLLHSRHLQQDVRTRDLRFVPTLDNELEFDWEAQTGDVIEAGNWMDPIDLHKHQGKKYLRSLYEAIRSQCARLHKVMENSENLLIGDAPDSWAAFFQMLSLIFNPTRSPLTSGSTAHTASRPPMSLDNSQAFKIVCNVVRATGIPIRSPNVLETESRQRSSDSSNMFVTQNIRYSNVRPFIALSYREKLCRTMTAEGSSPTWNEQLVLQLGGSLADLRDDLKITLFDEVIENHINDDFAVRNVDIYQRIQANWLGDYRIPISSILSQHKIEGVFELNTPKVLLGYKRASLENITSQADANITVDQYPEIKETVRLWFYISIEPTFELPEVNTTSLECSELREVRQHLHEWGLEMRELQPHRFIEPLVCTQDGKRVCLTRLLTPVPLPIEASEHLLDSACRFVALLNVPKSYDACMGFQGIWLNNQILLDTTWGSAKDLGVLLYNFLLTIGAQCWLVLGVASAYGETAFVLYRADEGELLLIDPCTGKRYSIKDVFCPLNKIKFVIAQDNIYCNVQSETRVSMTHFNFNDASCWLPTFNKRNPAPLGGVQNLSYKYHGSSSTSDLRKNIERKIMKKISCWRTMRKTIWNRGFHARLQGILQDLEHISTFVSGGYEDTNYAKQLSAEYPSYKMYGFTLNFPYTNLSSISDRIKSTGVHLNSDKNVEFSLAVHVHAYPNNVLSVWIFLMSLIPM